MNFQQAIQFVQITESNKEVKIVTMTMMRKQASQYTPEKLLEANITTQAVKNFLEYQRQYLEFKELFMAGVRGLETHKFAPELNKLWMLNDSYYRVNGVTTIDEAIRLIFNQTLKATKL